MNIKIWVGNLAQYNSGRLVGDWITLPMDSDELKERITAILGHDEECGIFDYEAPFKISEYENIDSLNELMQAVEDLEEDPNVIQAVLNNFSEYNEALDILSSGDYSIYSECDDMGDVAHSWLEETGGLSSIPDDLRTYFDYDKYGQDMALEGTFLRYTESETDKPGYVQILR